MEYHVSVRIDAKPEAIWPILTDAADYPAWNSTVERVEGDIALGRKVKVFTKLSPKRAFPVKVAALEAPRSMTWRGGMPFGLFKGVRTFTLRPQSDGTTEFTMREVFSGPMLGLIRKSMPDLQPAFDDFAKDLKKRVEGG